MIIKINREKIVFQNKDKCDVKENYNIKKINIDFEVGDY